MKPTEGRPTVATIRKMKQQIDNLLKHNPVLSKSGQSDEYQFYDDYRYEEDGKMHFINVFIRHRARPKMKGE